MDVKPEVNVTFEDQNGIFQVGKDAIKGNVEISLRKLMKTQMIKVEFKGICQVNWKKRGVSNTSQKNKTVEHFNIEDKLLTPRSEFNDLFLPPGSHKFPFVFQLPPAMPPTFDAVDGKIEYFTKVIVHYRDDGSMVSNELSAEAPLIMKKSVANFPPKFLQSVKLNECLSLPRFLSPSIRIEVQAQIPKRVYQRGEILRLTCDYKILNNNASSNVGDIHAVLMQGFSFVKPNGQEKTKTREILRAPPFHGHGDQSRWSDTYMNIPQDISLTVQGCGNVTIFYFIQVFSKKSKEKIDIPIVIIDSDERKVNSATKPRERRFSLTGATSGVPSMIQTFNSFDKRDPKRISRSSIESLHLYYNNE